MMKLKYKGKNALAALKAGEIGDVLEGELKTKKHSLKVGFNTPENPAFQFEASLYPGGKTCTAMASELEPKFKDACLLDKQAEVDSDPEIKSVNDFFDVYFEIKIKMNGDQSALGEKLNTAFEAFDIKTPSSVGGKWFKLKCVNEGEYMCIGTTVSVPHSQVDKAFAGDDKMKDMQWYHSTVAVFDQVQSVDQDLTVKLNLGTSVKDILNSETPLINELCKGFSFELQLEVIANLKKIIFDLLKDSETLESDLAPFLMGISPIILLTLNGKVDLNFEDYDEVKELPMMEPFLANFNQLFEGALG